MRLYLRECAGGAAVQVVPGVIHGVGMGLERGEQVGKVVAMMVERVERSAWL